MSKDKGKRLTCACGASAANTSRERARFLRRHPPDLDIELHMSRIRLVRLVLRVLEELGRGR